ncbi:hypothetical protein [Nocardioides pacificus]
MPRKRPVQFTVPGRTPDDIAHVAERRRRVWGERIRVREGRIRVRFLRGRHPVPVLHGTLTETPGGTRVEGQVHFTVMNFRNHVLVGGAVLLTAVAAMSVLGEAPAEEVALTVALAGLFGAMGLWEVVRASRRAEEMTEALCRRLVGVLTQEPRVRRRRDRRA